MLFQFQPQKPANIFTLTFSLKQLKSIFKTLHCDNLPRTVLFCVTFDGLWSTTSHAKIWRETERERETETETERQRGKEKKRTTIFLVFNVNRHILMLLIMFCLILSIKKKSFFFLSLFSCCGTGTQLASQASPSLFTISS